MTSVSDNATHRDNSSLAKEQEERTPLPLVQLFSVYFIQFAEPLTGLCIYPFINQFVRETGITGGDERKTGYYAGIIESAFFAAESLTVVQWGYLSDRFGRRPILLIAPIGLACSMIGFGMSTTFWSLVVARFFQGVFNGNIGVAKSVMAELTDSTNRADAYAIMPLAWSLGQTIGPFIGGALSNPAQRWPDALGRLSYLRTHPYFLPCAFTGLLALATFVVAFLVLKESLPSLVIAEKRRNRLNDVSDDITEETPLLGQTNILPETVATPPIQHGQAVAKPKFRDVLVRPILLTILSLGLLAFIDMCNFALIPLMWSTSIPLGGLGLDPFLIGNALGFFGLINAVVQVQVLGPVVRRYGARKVFRVAFSSMFFSFVVFPFLKHFVQRAGRVDGVTVGLIIAQLGCQMVTYFAYGTIHMMVVDNIPDGVPIGMTNGLAQMVGSGMRTIAPAFATSLFSISLQRRLAGGNLVYYLLMILTLAGIRCTALLPKDKAKGKRTAQVLS